MANAEQIEFDKQSINIRSAVESLGIKRVIDEVGLSRVIDELKEHKAQLTDRQKEELRKVLD